MRQISFLFIIAFFSLQSAFAQDDKEALRSLVHQFLAEVDSKAMHDHFWAEDLIYTSASGKRHGKSTIMAGFTSKNRASDNANSPVYTAEDIQIQLHGDVAVVAFKLVSTQTDGSRTEYLNSGTFVKRAEQWKVVNWQATKAAE